MLDLNIMQVLVADGQHNGVVRLHCVPYLNGKAQSAIDDIAAGNKDIMDATLLAEKQIIIIEAAKPTDDPETLKRISNGFVEALKSWFTKLDKLELDMVTYHPNYLRDADQAYSAVGFNRERDS